MKILQISETFFHLSENRLIIVKIMQGLIKVYFSKSFVFADCLCTVIVFVMYVYNV